MRVTLERAAEQEMLLAANYYDEQQSGLGSDFLDEIDAAIVKLGKEAGRLGVFRGSKNVRSIRIERFPYRLLFVLERTSVVVVAVMHLHRHPDYWKNR